MTNGGTTKSIIFRTKRKNASRISYVAGTKKSQKMHKFSLILFLNLTKLLYVFSVVENTSDNYLPFVVIKRQNQLEYPNGIENANINEIIGFTGDAQFSKDESIDQMFFCPANSTKQLVQIEEVNRLMQSTYWLRSIFSTTKVSVNCLFRKNFKKDEALQCANDPKPTIYRIRIRTGEPDAEIYYSQTCGPNNRGILYKFAYEACIPKTFFERIGDYIPAAFQSDYEAYKKSTPFQYERLTVYEICYNHDEEKAKGTIYTKHNLKSVHLLFDERLQHEKEKKHTMMTNGYENFGLDFRKLEQFYNRLLMTPVGQDEHSEGNPNIYLPEKLVSPDDMITAVLKKPTFHFINVKSMHQRLVELWNYMGDLVRGNFRNQKDEKDIEIYTGAFTLENLENYEYSPKNWSTNVPQVWIKVIHEIKSDPNSSPTLVIIMKNEYQLGEKNPSDNNFDSALELLCSDDHCKYFKQNRLEINRFSRLLENVRCCPFNDRIDSFFNINLTHGNTLLPIVYLTSYDSRRSW